MHNGIASAFEDSLALRQKILRDLWSSTVALFAVFDDHGKDRLEFAGSSTVVCFGGCHYVLTAAHVWEERLKSAKRIGITKTLEVDHPILLDIDTIVPTIQKVQASKWNEWGPDLVMLRVPPALVGGIKAFKVFEDLAAPLKQLHADAIVRWAVIGSPAEFATSTRTHANIKIAGGFINPQFHERGRHDYCDFVMDTTAAMPKDFGGLSGGGLWRIVVYRSSQTGEIDWGKRLEGVVFFQFPQEKGSRRLRSHGPKSLTSLVGSANPQAIKELPGLQSFGGLNSEV